MAYNLVTSVIKAKSGEPPGKLGCRRSRQKKKKGSQTLTPLPTNVMMMINELVRFLAADLKNYVQSLYHVRQPQE